VRVCVGARQKEKRKGRDEEIKLDFNVLPTIWGFRMAKERVKEIETDRQRQINNNNKT